jgi:2-polyprenyl-3-methyl-5-hydroxy-6-metoxy-1,4-benzoquinol methylase
MIKQLKTFNHRIGQLKSKFQKKRVNPSDYSSTLGIGSIVPVQIEAYLLALRKYIPENSSVLDVGFGLGYGLIISSVNAREVYGVDVDQKALEYCNAYLFEKLPTLKAIQLYDGYNIPYPDNYFDIIVSVDVLEHVPDYHQLLNEMMRVVSKGVFISTPNRRPEHCNPDGTPTNYWHLREWSDEELREILSAHGECDWNYINGPFNGPFTISDSVMDSTMALSPFIYKSHKD